MNLAYVVESNRSFDELVEDVEKKTAENGFRVLHVHDVRKTLQDKGFTFPGYKIIEICNAKLAHTVLQADRNIGLMMPCKINVYEKDGKRYLAGMLPSLISEFFPDASLGNAPEEVEGIIKKIINEVK
ncbi:MAG: DUF302 domain-containing protein [Bacteroidetes bacterium]|nr:DUF302 domain-containing protein [Bacteroidota bacterium]